MAERLTWTKLANGDLLCHEHPIRLDKPIDRSAEGPGWTILVPTEDEPDAGGDGWWWRPVSAENETWPIQASSEREIRKVVAEHLGYVLRFIQDDYPAWTTEQRTRIIEYEVKREAEWQERLAEINATAARAAANHPTPHRAPATPKAPSPAQMRKMLAEALDLLDRARPIAVSQFGKDVWLQRRDALREQAAAKGIPTEG